MKTTISKLEAKVSAIEDAKQAKQVRRCDVALHCGFYSLHLLHLTSRIVFHPWCPACNHCNPLVAFGCRRNETRHCASCKQNEPIEQTLSRPCKRCEPRRQGDGQARGHSDQLCQEMLQLLCGQFLESPRHHFAIPQSPLWPLPSARETQRGRETMNYVCQSATKTHIRIL
eukprot:COSAG02_NODE_12_length_58022_cov_242.077379_7_plen_171_part_00